MNKFIKFAMALVLAIGVTACNKEDPKADYQKLVEWNKTEAPVQNQLITEFQQGLSQAKDPQAVEAAIQKYKDGAKTVVESLDKLDLSSKEVKAFKEQSKALLNLSVEVTANGAKAAAAPLTDEEKAKLQSQVDELQDAVKKLAAADAALAQKYGEAAQPQPAK